MEEKLGIENIKEVLGTFLDVGILGYKSYIDDKHISTGEGIKLAFKIPSVWSAIKKIKLAIPEGKDLDPNELEDLMVFILDKLKELEKLQNNE